MQQQERESLEEISRKMLRPYALGLGLLYLFFSVSQFFLLPEDFKFGLSVLAAFTTANFFLVYFFSDYLFRHVSPSFIISYLCGLIYAKAAIYLVLSGDIQHTNTLLLIILCLACITFSWKVFYTYLAGIWIVFGAVFYQSTNKHVALSALSVLAAASILAKIVLGQRIRIQLELIRLYSQSRRIQAQELLSGSIAHELSTPIAALSLSTDFMEGHLQSNSVDIKMISKRIAIMKESIKGMAHLIQKLRVFARQSITKGRLQQLVLQEVINSTVILNKRIAAEHKIQITVDFPSQDLIVTADPSNLLAAFNSIITNSIEAMIDSKSARWIKISGTDTDEAITVTITDAGLGIKRDIQRRIFDPLFSTKQNIKTGVGFGLSTARSILSQINAEISYDDSFSNTTFVIQFNKQSPLILGKTA